MKDDCHANILDFQIAFEFDIEKSIFEEAIIFHLYILI